MVPVLISGFWSGSGFYYTALQTLWWGILFSHCLSVRPSMCPSIHVSVRDTLVFLAHLYVITGRAIAVTTASVSASASALLKTLKFLVKIFKSLYLLNPWMDLVDTLPDVRYWSEVLCCTITTYIGDLEVKVRGFEILS